MTNALVVPRALAGKTYNNRGASMWTQHIEYPGQWIGGSSYSWLTGRLSRILSERNRTGDITQVILSYNTPIAWLDGESWIIPDITYSPTTGKHQHSLWKLPNIKYVPADAGLDEYLQVLAGRAVYSRGYGGKLGTYRAA